MKTFLLSSLLSIVTIIASLSGEELVDKATGASFPSTVSFESGGKTVKLQATGVATRKKLVISVYSVASYLEEGVAIDLKDKFKGILDAKGAKQLTLKWARNVPLDKIKEAYQDSFKNVFSEQEAATLKDEIAKFVAGFSADAEKGEEYILRWEAPGKVTVNIKGKEVVSLSNESFAKGLWSIWFGEKSVVNRDQLVSLIKG